jgi:5-methylcytosine-specific restriction endonuclease McrA
MRHWPTKGLRARAYKDNRWQKITKRELIRAHGQRCQRCRRKLRPFCLPRYHPRNPHTGHIVPIAKGGKHTWSNIELLCQECNTKQGSEIYGQLEIWPDRRRW